MSRRVVLQHGNATQAANVGNNCRYTRVIGDFRIAEAPLVGRLFHSNEEVAPRPIRLLPRQQSGRSVKMKAHLYLVSRSGIHARNISTPSVVFITQEQLQPYAPAKVRTAVYIPNTRFYTQLQPYAPATARTAVYILNRRFYTSVEIFLTFFNENVTQRKKINVCEQAYRYYVLSEWLNRG
jgi:hypothetical protein